MNGKIQSIETNKIKVNGINFYFNKEQEEEIKKLKIDDAIDFEAEEKQGKDGQAFALITKINKVDKAWTNKSKIETENSYWSAKFDVDTRNSALIRAIEFREMNKVIENEEQVIKRAKYFEKYLRGEI